MYYYQHYSPSIHLPTVAASFIRIYSARKKSGPTLQGPNLLEIKIDRICLTLSACGLRALYSNKLLKLLGVLRRWFTPKHTTSLPECGSRETRALVGTLFYEIVHNNNRERKCHTYIKLGGGIRPPQRKKKRLQNIEGTEGKDYCCPRKMGAWQFGRGRLTNNPLDRHNRSAPQSTRAIWALRGRTSKNNCKRNVQAFKRLTPDG